MSHSVPTLILAFEDEARCRQRLEREGIAPCHAMEIASYLAQSTDIAHDLADIGAACTARGIAFLVEDKTTADSPNEHVCAGVKARLAETPEVDAYITGSAKAATSSTEGASLPS